MRRAFMLSLPPFLATSVRCGFIDTSQSLATRIPPSEFVPTRLERSLVLARNPKMKSLAIRAGLAVLGMAITLTWWTIHRGDSHSQSSSRIPDKVWSGGHTLEIEVESTSTATMRVSFSQHDKPAGEQQTLETYERIAAGTRSWTIDVPAHVGGYIEIEAEKPNPGDRLAMKVKSNGKLVDEQTEKLDQPLQSGYAFFPGSLRRLFERRFRKRIV
jgi:hypothetical protein